MSKELDFGVLSLKNIIVHDIPKHRKDDYSVAPNYSEAETILDETLKLFFKTKINHALNSDKSLKICFDTNTTSPMPYLVGETVRSDISQFVFFSKEMGKHLHEIQSGINPAGILLVMHGHVNMHRCCIVMKLERDSGAQLKLNEKTRSIDIQQVKDLMLTEKTKVFKVGVFFDREMAKTEYDGYVSDFQNNMKAKSSATSQFMENFLGCFPFDDPSISTKKFYELTRSFIFSQPDKLSQAKYLQDLNSYVQKNNTHLNPREFAEDYLNTAKERDAYKDFLTKNNFAFQSFPKSITLIDNKIKKITLEFANGISVIGDKGTFKEKVTITQAENGEHEATIKSRIKKVN